MKTRRMLELAVIKEITIMMLTVIIVEMLTKITQLRTW